MIAMPLLLMNLTSNLALWLILHLILAAVLPLFKCTWMSLFLKRMLTCVLNYTLMSHLLSPLKLMLNELNS